LLIVLPSCNGLSERSRIEAERAREYLSLFAKQSLVLLLGLDESFLKQICVVRVGEANGKSLGLWLAFADIGCGIPDPGAVGSNVWRKLHVGNNWYKVRSNDCEGTS
jgi:hypothetical protein